MGKKKYIAKARRNRITDSNKDDEGNQSQPGDLNTY